MNDDGPVTTRTMELITAAALMVIGATVMWDSARIGAGWDSNGPRSGYFPFYIGLLILISSGGTFAGAIFSKSGKIFVAHTALRSVLQVLVPTIVFGALIAFLGIYAASAVFIAYFMIRMGDFPWPTIGGVSLGVPIALFMLFEVWFLVPLPKGPIEALLGY
ncbi:MAG: tripartite tricarboxylate transporter TctB family protein [Alphaproteobacteria bacterium]|nr:tripartite tricarboxylate transporter TctB family protein [Alphaproteobacteria bacterium]